MTSYQLSVNSGLLDAGLVLSSCRRREFIIINDHYDAAPRTVGLKHCFRANVQRSPVLITDN